MKIEIEYEYKSAYGRTIRHMVVAESWDEAESYCKRIEEVEYKLVSVTRVE